MVAGTSAERAPVETFLLYILILPLLVVSTYTDVPSGERVISCGVPTTAMVGVASAVRAPVVVFRLYIEAVLLVEFVTYADVPSGEMTMPAIPVPYAMVEVSRGESVPAVKSTTFAAEPEPDTPVEEFVPASNPSAPPEMERLYMETLLLFIFAT
jgi:hypothetical protein